MKLYARSINVVRLAKLNKWNAVYNIFFNGRVELIEEIMKTFDLAVKGYQVSIVRGEAETSDKIFGILSHILSNEAVEFYERSERIFHNLLDTYQFNISNENLVQLIRDLVCHPSFLPSVTDNSVGQRLLENYLTDSSTILWKELLDNLTTKEIWEISIDNNDFLKELVFEFVNSKGHKKNQIKDWIVRLMNLHRFRPSQGNNFFVAFLMENSVSLFIAGEARKSWIKRLKNCTIRSMCDIYSNMIIWLKGEEHEIDSSSFINSWISQSLTKNSFNASGDDNTVLLDLIRYDTHLNGYASLNSLFQSWIDQIYNSSSYDSSAGGHNLIFRLCEFLAETLDTDSNKYKTIKKRINEITSRRHFQIFPPVGSVFHVIEEAKKLVSQHDTAREIKLKDMDAIISIRQLVPLWFDFGDRKVVRPPPPHLRGIFGA